MKSIIEILQCEDGENVEGYGRVIRTRNLGSISFYILYDQFSKIQIVDTEVSKQGRKVKKGDLITFEGKLINNNSVLEVHSFSINLLYENHSLQSKQSMAFDDYPMERDWIRARTTQVIHSFFDKQLFYPVQSPTIVSNWVEGGTGSFSTQFYEDSAGLSISNMLYHQILLTKRFSRIYELGKLFRMESPSSRNRLAEFSILDIGVAWSTVNSLQTILEDLITQIYTSIKELSLESVSLPMDISFSSVEYDQVLSAVGISKTTGSQLPGKARRWLNDNYDSFVWVNGFPQATRPFYVKSTKGQCDDTQLWYRGKVYIAAGGARETCPEIVKQKIIKEGKNPDLFNTYLAALGMGSPPMAGIGMGLERFLSTWVHPSYPADFNLFPRYRGKLEP